MSVLSDLLPIITAQVTAAQGKLAACRKSEREIEQQIIELRQARVADRPANDLASQSGADLKWHRWIDQRLSDLAVIHAKARVETLAATDRLKAVMGRQIGLQSVIESEAQEATLRRSRRADYAS